MSTRSALDRYRTASKHTSHHSYIPLSAGDLSSQQNHRHSSILSSRFSRRSLAAIAIEKTSSAFNNLASLGSSSNHPVRSPSSIGNHHKSVRLDCEQGPPGRDHRGVGESGCDADKFPYRPSSQSSNSSTDSLTLSSPPAAGKHNSNFNSTPNNNTFDPRRPLPQYQAAKMHQTSSRLLRMTGDDRPYTRDFKDLFATLMVSLKLETHRVRFSKFDHSFTSEEAINNLGSLKFSQSNRMPDPKDPSRIVTTTTTTTFSMAKEMARSVCQRFADARFVEPVDGRVITQFPLKGALYQLTPKGINILHQFCQRNGITARHIMEVLDSPRNTMQLVTLERDTVSDKLSNDRGTAEVIFRRFAGQDGPNIKSSTSSSDSDSLSDYTNGLVGVKMAKDRKIGDKVYQNTFTGKAAVDWLMDCCTTIDRREALQISELFLKLGLICCYFEDKIYIQQDPSAVNFQPTKHAIYGLTEHGQRVCGWLARDKQGGANFEGRNAPRDSNNARLQHILQDPALRLLFREFLRYSLCEENLAFYLDVSDFTATYRRAEKAGAFSKMDAVRETLASAYGLYNAFLAPGSPCELNIDHALRNSLASRMTRAVGDDASMVKSLTDVVQLFEAAQLSVFKLMSSDSVPKFVRDPKYSIVLQEHDFDLTNNGRSYSPTPAPVPERSMSRSART
ncbi:hypothetical protein FQN57_003025 [Myotisia sp. PD_48]|nr:hypothetical protein FQN57_003025 [Myotisia sp. PD_48]